MTSMKAKLLRSLNLSPSKIREHNSSQTERSSRNKNRASFTSYLTSEVPTHSSSVTSAGGGGDRDHHGESTGLANEESGSWNIIDENEVGILVFALLSSFVISVDMRGKEYMILTTRLSTVVYKEKCRILQN